MKPMTKINKNEAARIAWIKRPLLTLIDEIKNKRSPLRHENQMVKVDNAKQERRGSGKDSDRIREPRVINPKSLGANTVIKEIPKKLKTITCRYPLVRFSNYDIDDLTEQAFW